MAYLGLGSFFVGGEVANILDEVAIREHFQNLCAKVGVECKEHVARAQAATQTRDWVSAYSEWTSCRDVIERSKSLLDRDDWLWLSGCHKLMCADLCAFYSMNFGEALRDAMAAFKAGDEVQNVPEALDFKSYVEPILWKAMYLWASTSDCKEEALELDVEAFLIDSLGHSRDSVSDSEVRTLKQQCKELVINKSESVMWQVQTHYYYYSKTEECLQWASEGNKLYKERHSGNLDYVSKFNEALTLMMLGAYKKAAAVGEIIVDELDSEPWKGKVTDDHPAAQYCNPLFEFLLHQMLCLCYQSLWHTRAELDEEKHQNLKELASEEEAKCLRLSEQIEVQEMFLYSRECLLAALIHGGNKWEEGYEKCFAKSRVNHYWVNSDKFQFLLKICTTSKTKYRQSYESGSPDESHFSTANACAMKLLEPNLFPRTDSTFEAHAFLNLVRLHHEKDREIMFLKEPRKNIVNVNEAAPILLYGKRAINCYVQSLVKHANDEDYWITVQGFYKDVYDMLQFHYFALWIANLGCTLNNTSEAFRGRLQLLWYQSLLLEEKCADSSLRQEIWKQSLMWAERRVAKTIYFQLDPNMLSTSTRDQLVEFDLKDDAAWNALKYSRAACGPGTFVLEYSVSEENHLQFVYVMTKEDEVFTQILDVTWLEMILPKILVWLREIFSQKSQEKIELLDRALQWMYLKLISPVANLLDKMEQEDKLIIVAPEILSNVPFAALQKPNSPVGEGYLIQSHTISVTPSLRMIQHCDQRLKELDQDDTKPGIIVAVGDPTKNLEQSGKEVVDIEKLFGEKHVKKLVGSEATPREVLKWAKYPSENPVKQVIFHIAAHGIGQDGSRNVKKGAIVLAQPASSSQQICGPARRGAMLRAQDDENFDDDNAYDKTEPGDLFSMVDVKEEAQMSGHGEVGGVRSGIAVPISGNHPYLLKSENISGCGFRWEAHMVVLSACDTARGQITGEGVLNLPRALMIAGVPCVVASQWEVDDSSTCELMKGFYQELRSGKDVSSSLRAAMLKMMKDEGNVHAWAPFFVCGLPTVCLPTELQAGTSSCKGCDCGTSSDTKVELRVT